MAACKHANDVHADTRTSTVLLAVVGKGFGRARRMRRRRKKEEKVEEGEEEEEDV